MVLLCCVFSMADGKVQWDTSRTIHSECGPFIIHHQPRDEKMALMIEGLLCESASVIAAELGLERPDTVNLYLAGDHESFKRLHHSRLQEWGEAFSDLRRMIIGIDADAVLRTPRPLNTVISHELSHIFFAQRVGGVRCPTWFLEGVAMRQSREWTFGDQWNLVSSIWRRTLPDLEDLKGPFPRPVETASIAYKLSYAAVEELFSGRPGDLITLTSFIRDLGDFDRAFILTFGETPEDFTLRFHLELEKRYRTAGALMQSTPFWLFIVCLFLLAYIIKGVRSKRKLREWESDLLRDLD